MYVYVRVLWTLKLVTWSIYSHGRKLKILQDLCSRTAGLHVGSFDNGSDELDAGSHGM